MFISEYIHHKYPDLYHEAGSMYNEMNVRYPRKPDLRKCKEFREWKNSVAVSKGQQITLIPREKAYKYMRTEYSNIVLNPTNESPIESPTTPQENGYLNRPLTQRIMCLNIPLMSPPCDSTSYETVIEEGDWTTQEPDQTTDPSTPQEPATQEPDQATDPSTPQEPATQEPEQATDPSTPQEPVEQCMDPSIMDQIPPEIIEKIIEELRIDPALKDLMEDVESQIEEELIGLEVDVPELDNIMDQDLIFW